MEDETRPNSLAVPGDWQGPQTADRWWCTHCGLWERCNDEDVCDQCVTSKVLSETPGRGNQAS